MSVPHLLGVSYSIKNIFSIFFCHRLFIFFRKKFKSYSHTNRTTRFFLMTDQLWIARHHHDDAILFFLLLIYDNKIFSLSHHLSHFAIQEIIVNCIS